MNARFKLDSRGIVREMGSCKDMMNPRISLQPLYVIKLHFLEEVEKAFSKICDSLSIGVRVATIFDITILRQGWMQC